MTLYIYNHLYISCIQPLCHRILVYSAASNIHSLNGRQVVLVDGFDTIFGGCSEEKLRGQQPSLSDGSYTRPGKHTKKHQKAIEHGIEIVDYDGLCGFTQL